MFYLNLDRGMQARLVTTSTQSHLFTYRQVSPGLPQKTSKRFIRLPKHQKNKPTFSAKITLPDCAKVVNEMAGRAYQVNRDFLSFIGGCLHSIKNGLRREYPPRGWAARSHDYSTTLTRTVIRARPFRKPSRVVCTTCCEVNVGHI